MNLNPFRRLFGGSKAEAAASGAPASPVAPAVHGAFRPPVAMPRPEASRVKGEDVRAYCEKLEREADRTGNARLRQQARNIRSRLLS